MQSYFLSLLVKPKFEDKINFVSSTDSNQTFVFALKSRLTIGEINYTKPNTYELGAIN